MKKALYLPLFFLLLLFSCKPYVYQTSVQQPERENETLLSISLDNLPGTYDEIYTKCEEWMKTTMGSHPKCCLFMNDKSNGKISGRYLLYCNETVYGAEVYSDIVVKINNNQATISFLLCDPWKCSMAINDGIYYSYLEALSDSNSLSNRFEAYLRSN